VAQYLDEAHDGEMLDVFDELDARVAHGVATDAHESIGSAAGAQLSRDTSRMQIAGRFAGDE
jgi:hypothetical protein